MVLVPKRDLHHVIKKWVRGLNYLMLRQLLPRSQEIHVFHVTDEVTGLAFHDVEPFAPTHIKPPSVFVMYASATEGKRAMTIYRFMLWDQYKVCAAVSRGF